jgi:PAS domain S-box-containing protein
MTDKEIIAQLEDKIINLHEGYRKQLLNLEKFKAMVTNLNLGLLVVDNDDIITKVFPSFEELTGYSESELLGKRANDILLRKGDMISNLQIKEQQLLREKGESSTYEIPIQAKSGEEIWVTISGSPLYSNDGVKIGSIGIHLDITRQKRLQKSLQKAREESDRSKRAEERFLAKMSHEIRTPLNAVIGMSYLLSETEINKEQEEYVEVISRSSNLLLNLINDILDYSKVNSGQIQVRQTPTDLTTMLNDLAQTFRLKSQGGSGSIKIATNLDMDNSFVLTDETLLNQVFMNLLSNAEKFTREGEIRIEAKVLSELENAITYQFTVSDTGVGIAPERIDAIFQEFVQEEGIFLNSSDGTGLGLAITKRIVELLDGQIWVESKLKVGTSIHLVLPFQRIEKVEIEKVETIEEKNIEHTDDVLHKLSVLVAEDNQMNQTYIGRILDKTGAYYEIVENGQKALECCKRQKFDMIFMDLFMPIIDGFEATDNIRKTENPNKNTPIYALTSTAVVQHKKRAHQAGMNGFISKPFHPNEIKQVLMELSKMLQHKSDNSSVKRDLTFTFNKAFDEHSLQMYYVGDIEYALEIFNIFIVQLEESLPVLTDALKGGQSDDVRKIVHKLKPTFTMVGFPMITSYFEFWEKELDNGMSGEKAIQKWLDIKNEIKNIDNLVKQEIKRMKPFVTGK